MNKQLLIFMIVITMGAAISAHGKELTGKMREGGVNEKGFTSDRRKHDG
jgi:hypothetical protein